MDYKQSGHGQQVDSSFYAALQAFNVDRHTQTDRKASGDLPMGMTTPKTATVRFSPRRKCSLPAEERDGNEKEELERERTRVRKKNT